VDAAGNEVDMLPPEREHLARAQPAERPDRICDVQRLLEVEIDAPDVRELLDERRRARVVRRLAEAPRRPRQ
jgi:hypothetical protein